MAIDFQREEYKEALPEWSLVDIVCDEKNLGDLLPELVPDDKSEENRNRNAFYRERASWFGASQMTLAGLIGVAFEDTPDIELPQQLAYMEDSADGTGVSLEQQMQRATNYTLRHGRAGLFVTYPFSEEFASLADQEAGDAVATIHLIKADRIINWWTQQQGAQSVLAGVVFMDCEEEIEDYDIVKRDILREISLEEGRAVDRIWRKPEGSKNWEPDEPRSIVDSSGAPMDELPFTFIGSVDNNAEIDRPPMLSLARLNRDHYRNSADNEESLWYAGQAQPFIEPADGMQQSDLDQAKADGFYIGSRQLIMGKLGFAQADPNSAVRQAMIDKVEQMKGLGARFLMPGTVAKTAQQDAGEQKVQHSVLSLIVANVEEAYTLAMRWAAGFVGSPEATVTLSRDFMKPAANAEMISRMMELWDRGLLGAEDVAPVLKRARLINAETLPEEYAEAVAERGGLMPPPEEDADA